MSRKGVKSRTGVPGLRSTRMNATTRVDPMSKPRADLKQQLEKSRRELAEAREHLAKALERETATSGVLRVISSSPGKLEPVFEAMLASATRLCEAKLGILYRYDNGLFHPAALVGAPPALADFIWQRGPFIPPVGAALDRLLQTKEVVHTLDQAEERVPVPWATLVGARSHLNVPITKTTS